MEPEEAVRFDKQRDAASYDQAAPSYSKYINQLSAPLARRAIALAELKTGQQVLDVGTGSGICRAVRGCRIGPNWSSHGDRSLRRHGSIGAGCRSTAGDTQAVSLRTARADSSPELE